MYAGLENARGDLVAILDADLQDPPALLPEMYASIKNDGYDSVATRRSTRKGEPRLRSFFARVFYRLMNKISKTELVEGARDFRLMTRQMVDSVLSVCEYNRFTKGIFTWVGYKTRWIEYENVERVAGGMAAFDKHMLTTHAADNFCGAFHIGGRMNNDPGDFFGFRDVWSQQVR